MDAVKRFRAGGRYTAPSREIFVLRRLEGDRRIDGETVAADEPALSADQRQVILAVYGEVHASWRDLHSVRFRLLGLLPLATLGILSVALKPGAGMSQALLAVAVTALGLLVTLGLWIYDKRNSELYDDLVSRGRRIEAELGLGAGVFLQRPRNRWRFISHGTATGLVYAAVLAAWVAGLALAAHQAAAAWAADDAGSAAPSAAVE